MKSSMKLKRSVGAFLRACGGSSFYLRIETAEQSRAREGWDRSPHLPGSAFTLLPAYFLERFTWQNDETTGNTEVRFYSGI